MSLMTVGRTRHGDSLPAELRVRREYRGSLMGLARLDTGLHGLTGVHGLGEMVCDDGGNCFDDGSGSGTGITPIDTPPVPIVVSPTTVGPLAPGETFGPPPGGFVCAQDANGNCTTPAVSTASLNVPALAPPPGYNGPTTLNPASPTPAAPPGYQWAQLVNQSGQTLAKVLAISQGGSSIQLPNGTQIVYGSAAAGAGAGALISTAGGLGSFGPLLLLAGGLFLVMSLRK